MKKYYIDKTKDPYEEEKVRKVAKSKICASFALRLNQCLIESEMNQEEFAERVELSTASISKYLSGITEPRIEFSVKAAEIFKVSTDYLLGITDFKSSNIDNQEIHKRLGLSDKAIEVLEEQNKLSESMDLNEIINIMLAGVMPQKIFSDEKISEDLYKGIDTKKLNELGHKRNLVSNERLLLFVMENRIAKNKELLEIKIEKERDKLGKLDILTEIGRYLNIKNPSDSVYIYIPKDKRSNVKASIAKGKIENLAKKKDDFDEHYFDEPKVTKIFRSYHLIEIQNILQEIKSKYNKSTI